MSDADARQTALITGAAQGLGAAIAHRLHEDGFRVALADIDTDAADSVASRLDGSGRTARAFRVDVSDVDSLHSLHTDVAAAWGSPGVLVNNAGRTVRRSVWEITPSEWDGVMETNLRSYLILCQLAGAAMREAGWGRIVNMSSFAGQQGGLVAGAHYAASKAGILVLTKIFAKELAPFGVTVNAIAPAAIRTGAMSDTEAEQIGASLPVGRVGGAEDVAEATAYLVGPHSGFVTGTTIDLNGGAFMR